MPPTPFDFDVLIVGAGLSGISMAAHLGDQAPTQTYAILERREQLGGTWDLFRYPGVRSDSDMHTLGFDFEPWRHEKSIADGAAILDYLARIVDERDIRRNIRFGQTVVSADWREADACWHVTTSDHNGTTRALKARWLYLGTGYYDYDEPFDAGFDASAFSGQVVHPQFWPQDLEYSGKQVVVIGSGATAVTLVPAMAKSAAHVTMLQRTPTWMFSAPAKDRIANALRKILPEDVAYRLTRWKNITLQQFAFRRAKAKPATVAKFLSKRMRKALGRSYDPVHFTPPYDPWDQRLCLIPDNDLFDAIKAGKADVVTSRIDRFGADGITLQDGRHIPADIIVTATGLNLAIAGKMTVSLDGEPVDFADHYYYKGCMFSNVPNFSVVFGYLNASWTLRADLNADFVCRVLNHMAASRTEIAVPELPEDHALAEDDIFDFSSGYIQRSRDIMPKSAPDYPWRLNMDYREDRKRMAEPVTDGVLDFRDRHHDAGEQAA